MNSRTHGYLCYIWSLVFVLIWFLVIYLAASCVSCGPVLRQGWALEPPALGRGVLGPCPPLLSAVCSGGGSWGCPLARWAGALPAWAALPTPKVALTHCWDVHLPSLCNKPPPVAGLHEEVDYSEKLKFSDDEEEGGSGEGRQAKVVRAPSLLTAQLPVPGLRGVRALVFSVLPCADPATSCGQMLLPFGSEGQLFGVGSQGRHQAWLAES